MDMKCNVCAVKLSQDDGCWAWNKEDDTYECVNCVKKADEQPCEQAMDLLQIQMIGDFHRQIIKMKEQQITKLKEQLSEQEARNNQIISLLTESQLYELKKMDEEEEDEIDAGKCHHCECKLFKNVEFFYYVDNEGGYNEFELCRPCADEFDHKTEGYTRNDEDEE